MPIIKTKCKVCGAEKSKWAMCRNTEAHDKLFRERMDKEFGYKQIFPDNWFNGTHNDVSILSK
jgi:hypothetical protein